ncbi:Predicted metal-dependent phosphohydrolase, HD superfamily [Polaribacter sp. Hel1_33_78]|jgi:predicted metal-dependent HD superfamily phosphohydrolase|uniref:Pycsar system effector family protein n=1 Tax=unclassified Polaribacter TaxID=196858 RepID=UPI00052B820D|nr:MULTISPECIES: Pycsar system effector family protein [unclassified Polaribacter]KGL58506.1 metal-dependent phosphohydrolase, HD subdomain [Polaribacter sp. Hel1_33_49]MBT7815709.1 HD domain-containing protein [Polaribacter sp.]PKV65835.1 putative metal-dependent HD superfamily phosphohydrolase [Polaribacter sp. Hel1_33_96]SDT90379.1 Predicted metal-dependent phosphohydrolase, HD superfamily [Polaribacter sp. Hel1_33_78]
MATLLIDAEKYVSNLLNNKLATNYVYHNLVHTQGVVKSIEKFIEKLAIPEIDAENLQVAAWFHDTGFIKGAENHEEESVKILTLFLTKKNVEVKRIETISNLILATKIGHEATNDLEKIITDADCAHLGNKSFEDKTALLRKEWEATENKKYSDAEWGAVNIDFLTKVHKYRTDYALKNWSKGKEKNLAKLLKNKNKLTEDLKKYEQKKEALDIKKNKSDVPERGVETMFRVALKNHMTLSNIADTKANILLSVNAIIVSLALSNLLPKLDNPSNDYLIIPTLIFIIFTVASIILSILATRPNVTQGKFTKEDVANKKVNLLFFGNFHKMKLPDFEWGITEMMQDRDYLYGSLTKDLYFLGLVLDRKYKILRLTYTVFMIGIIVSVGSFAISFYLQGR